MWLLQQNFRKTTQTAKMAYAETLRQFLRSDAAEWAAVNEKKDNYQKFNDSFCEGALNQHHIPFIAHHFQINVFHIMLSTISCLTEWDGGNQSVVLLGDLDKPCGFRNEFGQSAFFGDDDITNV